MRISSNGHDALQILSLEIEASVHVRLLVFRLVLDEQERSFNMFILFTFSPLPDVAPPSKLHHCFPGPLVTLRKQFFILQSPQRGRGTALCDPDISQLW